MATVTTEEIWHLLSAKLRAFLRTRLPDEQTAEDLLQETFLRIHQKLDQVTDEQRLSGWVFQIARNLVIDFYRSKDRTQDVELPTEIDHEDKEQNNINEQVSAWLQAMISTLPDNDRQALTLYELQKIPQKEIAAQLNLSLSGTKSRIQRGRQKLKTMLLACCSFEKDSQGNIIACSPNTPDTCQQGSDHCSP